MKSQFHQHTKYFLSAFRSAFALTTLYFLLIHFILSNFLPGWPAGSSTFIPSKMRDTMLCVCVHMVSRAIVNQIAKLMSGTDFPVNVNLIQMNSQPFFCTELWRRSMIMWITFLGINEWCAHPSLRSMSFKKFHRTWREKFHSTFRVAHWLCTNLPLPI